METYLTIKHLAPYLPYELKIRCGEMSHPILTCADTNEFEIAVKEVFINSAYKPILRPLSDLTKEIEVNGEKFVPLEKLKIIGMSVDLNENGLELVFDNDYLWVYLHDFKENIYDKLLEWHFDVFGLIEKNLAIDINTLPQSSE